MAGRGRWGARDGQRKVTCMGTFSVPTSFGRSLPVLLPCQTCTQAVSGWGTALQTGQFCIWAAGLGGGYLVYMGTSAPTLSFCIGAAGRRIKWRVLGLIIKAPDIGLLCDPKNLAFGKMEMEVGRQEGEKESTGGGRGWAVRGRAGAWLAGGVEGQRAWLELNCSKRMAGWWALGGSGGAKRVNCMGTSQTFSMPTSLMVQNCGPSLPVLLPPKPARKRPSRSSSSTGPMPAVEVRMGERQNRKDRGVQGGPAENPECPGPKGSK